MLEYVREGKWRRSCLMILISSVRKQIISSSKTADVGLRALKRVQSFEQLLLGIGCPCDRREEDCEKATKNVNERSVPYTSVAH